MSPIINGYLVAPCEISVFATKSIAEGDVPYVLVMNAKSSVFSLMSLRNTIVLRLTTEPKSTVTQNKLLTSASMCAQLVASQKWPLAITPSFTLSGKELELTVTVADLHMFMLLVV